MAGLGEYFNSRDYHYEPPKRQIVSDNAIDRLIEDKKIYYPMLE